MADIINFSMQTRMPIDDVPVEKKPPVYRNYADVFMSELVDQDAKLRIIEGWLATETHNGVRKDDLLAALRWLVSVTCEYE